MVVVLTTVWVELMSDPKLFQLRQKIITRDHKLIAAFSLLAGGFIGQSLLSQIGAGSTLGMGTGICVLITLVWIIVPGKPVS